MKLGILVVYLVSPGNEWVLDKHLEHLSRTQKYMEFNVYAAINRLSSRFHSALRSHKFVKVVDLPSVEERDGAEHGTYLDMLVAHAIHDGCDYISTFDVDSWPIRDDWIQVAYNLLTESGAVGAAVLRAENGDTTLPHPSFSFFEARLFRDPNCRYWIPEGERVDELLNYLHENEQAYDVGASIGFFLYQHNLKLIILLRTNVLNYHYLMGGVYGDVIFHLGASSRRDMLFRKDGATWVTQITRPLGSIPFLWRYTPMVQRALMSCYQPTVCRRNRRTFATIAERLRADEESFYRELRGLSSSVSV